MNKIKVLLADDHPVVMGGFAMALAGFGVEVVGQVRTPAEAVEAYQALVPDVAILDMRFGEQMTAWMRRAGSWPYPPKRTSSS
ncbi:response regulator transcription factor [Massilia eburnea]|uniref:response regulator transcription factor n=1 Tax=Massilia eburnea TaxID=1776165 RepID=UPI003D6B8F4C